MILLYKYMFCRVYYFYVNAFKETDIPHYFATAVVSVLFMTNVVFVMDSFFFFFKREWLDFGSYYKFLALIVLFAALFFIQKKQRYQHILNDHEQLSKRARNTLLVISVFYVLVSGFSICWIGEEIRQFHVENPKM